MNTVGLLTKTGTSYSSSSCLLQPSCIFILSAFVNAAGNEYRQQREGVLPHGQLGAFHTLRPLFPSLWVRQLSKMDANFFFSLHLRLSLMHLFAALKGYGLMIGDHSGYLRCSCKYSNEPSWVDGVRDNGSIFYLPLLVCDTRIYIVDGIIVPKSAWFAGINFSRNTPLPVPAEANAYSFTRLSFQ